MPQIGSIKFPYTKEGKAKAAKLAKALGVKVKSKK